MWTLEYLRWHKWLKFWWLSIGQSCSGQRGWSVQSFTGFMVCAEVQGVWGAGRGCLLLSWGMGGGLVRAGEVRGVGAQHKGPSEPLESITEGSRKIITIPQSHSPNWREAPKRWFWFHQIWKVGYFFFLNLCSRELYISLAEIAHIVFFIDLLGVLLYGL